MKKKKLEKSQPELKSVVEQWEGLKKEVGMARSTVDDAKSSMQANRSRCKMTNTYLVQ